VRVAAGTALFRAQEQEQNTLLLLLLLLSYMRTLSTFPAFYAPVFPCPLHSPPPPLLVADWHLTHMQHHTLWGMEVSAAAGVQICSSVGHCSATAHSGMWQYVSAAAPSCGTCTQLLTHTHVVVCTGGGGKGSRPHNPVVGRRMEGMAPRPNQGHSACDERAHCLLWDLWTGSPARHQRRLAPPRHAPVNDHAGHLCGSTHCPSALHVWRLAVPGRKLTCTRGGELARQACQLVLTSGPLV